MVAFTPTRQPVFPLARKRQPKILFNEFGDGYTQRAAHGTNNNPVTIDLTWNELTKIERDALVDSLTARGAVESFTWEEPDTLVTSKFICLTWTDNLVYYDGYSIQATFKQVFDVN